MKLSRYFFFVLMAFCVSTSWALEGAAPVFDQRPWVLGWTNTEEGRVIEEYVLQGESVKHWSELLTLHFLPGAHEYTHLEIVEASIRDRMKRICPNLVFISMARRPKERTWFFTFKNCSGQPDQSEIARAIEHSKGVYIFRYTIKKSPIPKDTYQTWTKNLVAIKVDP